MKRDERTPWNMETLSNFLTPIVAIIAIVTLWRWSWHDQQERLKRWSIERRFQLLEAKPCFVLRGPFQWSASHHQAVYRVVIADGHNEQFSGWVCMGHFHWLTPDEFRVEWDGLRKPRSF